MRGSRTFDTAEKNTDSVDGADMRELLHCDRWSFLRGSPPDRLSAIV